MSVYSSLAVQHERKGTKENKTRKGAPGSYQRLDLFMKVLRVLCPNLTDDPWTQDLTIAGFLCHNIKKEREVSTGMPQWKIMRDLENYSRKEKKFSFSKSLLLARVPVLLLFSGTRAFTYRIKSLFLSSFSEI